MNQLIGIILLVSACLINCNVVDGLRIGVGRADCTGPPVEVVFVSKYLF